MEFVLKKVAGALLMPLPLSVLVLALGCLLLWRGYLRWGRGFITGGLTLQLLASCTALSDLSLLPLEEAYPKWDGRNHGLAYVVVMGASQGDAPRLPLTNRPNTAAVYRLLEGIAVYRANPGSKLILSGGTGTPEPHALLMADVAEQIGVPAHDILLQTQSLDTEQEAALLAPMVGQSAFAVVTSAAHMPRTLLSFARLGLSPLAAPTHFLDRDNPHPNWRDFALPSADSLGRSEFAVHEYLGFAWLKLKMLFE